MIVAFLLGCNPNLSVEELSQISKNIDSISVEEARNVIISYTDSAQLRATIRVEILKRYPDESNPKLEMSQGVSAIFYDNIGDTSSVLTSKNATHFEKEDRIEIRDSVCVLNRNDEEIKTDELIWHKKKRRVTSNKSVSVKVRDEKIINAEGFESDEDFLNYKFTRVTGVIYLKEDLNDSK